MEAHAATTATLWASVGSKPIADVVPQMKKEGWTPLAVKHGGLSCVVLSKDKVTVQLYARNDVVGMVNTIHRD